MSKTIMIEIPDFQPLVNETRAMEVDNAELCRKIKQCAVSAGASIPDQIGQYVYEMLLPVLNEGKYEELSSVYDAVTRSVRKGREYLIVRFIGSVVSLVVNSSGYEWRYTMNFEREIEWNPSCLASLCGGWPKVKRILHDLIATVYRRRQDISSDKVRNEKANFDAIINFKL